jgi:hypothetical protein
LAQRRAVEAADSPKRSGPWRHRTALVGLLVAWTGCAGSGASFVNPAIDFSYIRRCAVLPFQNLTDDSFADERLQSIFLMELLSHGSLAVVDLEETASAMRAQRIVPGSTLTPEQVVSLGKVLEVEAVFLGSVEEYGLESRSRRPTYSLTTVFSMAETETGNIIWRSQAHVDGSSFWKKIFGGEPAGQFDVSRKAVRKALETLF